MLFHSKIRKSGFTLIEIMVVIVVMGILAGVAVPKVFGLIEKSKEEIDLLKLFYLRDSLNRALIDDENAIFTNKSVGNLSNSLKNGIILFVFSAQDDCNPGVAGGNVQGATGDWNTGTFYKLVGNSGAWFNALKEAGFEGVADILIYRSNGMNNNFKTNSFSIGKYGQYQTTYPKSPMFISRALNCSAQGQGQVYYGVQFIWSGKNPDSHSLEVYLAPKGKNSSQAFRSEHGVCFSTLGPSYCR